MRDIHRLQTTFHLVFLEERIEFEFSGQRERRMIELLIAEQWCRHVAQTFRQLAAETMEAFVDMPQRTLHQDAAIVHDNAIIDQSFQILNDVRGKEDRLTLTVRPIPEIFDKESTITRIETHREIIENQQFGILCQEQTECHLAALTVRHTADALSGSHLEFLHQFIISLLTPLSGIELGVEMLDLLDVHELILHMVLDKQAYLLTQGRIHRLDILPEYTAFSRTGLEISAQEVDGCGLACAILTQKTEDAAFGHIETQVFVNLPFPIVMGQVDALDDVFHYSSVTGTIS